MASEATPSAGGVTLVSLIPELHAGTGHVLGYHLSVARAAALNGWRHEALAPVDHGLARLPDGWRGVLRPATVPAGLPQALRQRRFVRLLRDIRAFSASIRSALQGLLDETTGPCVVMLERFNGPTLLAVSDAIGKLPFERLHFWLMFREDPAAAGWVGRAYTAVARRLAARMPAGHMLLLADSDSLAGAVKSAIGREAHVLPIPHTHYARAQPHPRSADEIVCWWPGPPRAEKGQAVIESLARLPADKASARITFVVSEQLRLRCGGAVHTRYVPARLSDEDYDGWLRTADIVLLPYGPGRYRHSTSGIFAEAVVNGPIPLVSGGTWMAQQLQANDLGELVTDWHDGPEVLRRIEQLARDELVRAKLARMRERFAAYHSEPSYAATMRALLETSMQRGSVPD